MKLLFHRETSIAQEVVMEGMDAEMYVIEYLIRDRLLDARARARSAALLAQVSAPPRSKRTEIRLVDVGRALVSRARKVDAGRARIVKRLQLSLSARRSS